MNIRNQKIVKKINQLFRPFNETALLNIIQDLNKERMDLVKKNLSMKTLFTHMEEGKKKQDEQRVAIYNILEDVTEAQTKLKNQYKYVDNLRVLLEKLTLTVDIEVVMQDMVDIYQNLFPFYSVSYVIAEPKNEKDLNAIYIFSKGQIGQIYVNKIQEELLNFLQKLPSAVGNRDQLYKRVKSKLIPQVIGEYKEDLTLMPLDSFVVPLISRRKKGQEKLLGLFYIAADEKNEIYTQDKITSANDIANIVALNMDRIQDLIKSEHARLSDLLNSMEDAVLMFDVNQNIIVANPMLKKIALGTHAETFTFKDFINIFKGVSIGNEDNINITEIIKKVLEKGELLQFPEVYLKDKFFQIFATPVRDYEQKISGGAFILHDITHLKEVDKMKTEFVSVASHQLRTPLTGINWYLEMLLSGDAGEVNPQQKEYLEAIYDGSKRMVQLVNDLLNVSRVETGRLKIDPSPVKLDKFIQDVIDESYPLTHTKGCKVMFNKPKGELPEIMLDSSLMHQVFHNLITNAIKYSKEINCSVHVILEKRETDYLVAVKDNGIGIPEEMQPRIFDKFFRADNAVQLETEGSGLGLYIVKMIVQAIGGKVWFESKEGEGTSFYFTIPITGMKQKDGEKGLAGK